MNEDKTAMIPYFVHEGEMARAERTNKRLWILCLILILLLTGSNALWFWYENQFEDVVTTTQTVTQDIDTGDGPAIVNDGVHVNGEGGYSRAGEDIAEQLRDIMQDAPDERVRMEIERLANKVEKM